MGLFDEILCEYPLPEWPAGEDPRFQTKDLDCLLERYRITVDGRLLTTRYRRGSLDETESPRELDTEFYGFLVFYTSVERDGEREWYEYRAKFTDGRIVEVERVDEGSRLRSL